MTSWTFLAMSNKENKPERENNKFCGVSEAVIRIVKAGWLERSHVV